MRQNNKFQAEEWDKFFPGQIPESPILATTPPGNTFELEGNKLRIVEVGHSDTDNSTVLHVPSIGLSGDRDPRCTWRPPPDGPLLTESAREEP
jgi:hypothetical protein